MRVKDGPVWLVLCTLTAKGLGLSPAWSTKILQAIWYYRNKKKRERKSKMRTFLGM